MNEMDFIETIEKYKVARIQYLPAIEDGMIDTLIVSVKPLLRKLQVGGQTVQITKAESINVEQGQIFNAFIQWYEP